MGSWFINTWTLLVGCWILWGREEKNYVILTSGWSWELNNERKCVTEMYHGAGLQKYKRYNTIRKCVGIRIAETYRRAGYPNLYIREQGCTWEREGIKWKRSRGLC